MIQARKQSSKNKHQQSKNKTFQNHQHQKNKNKKKPKHPTKRQAPQFNPTQTKQKNTLSRTQTTKPQTNQNWPVRIRREQKISGGKVFLPPASALGNEYKVTVLSAQRQTRFTKSKRSHINF
ncbi:hypothetical protein [Varibaculum prostatecancerukia]|uniref:hypothetical protein n=1 Tax=Varibaculum prostatecancerukia TaxID=2811781 RepID=UPI001BFFEA59|nr:hypothetical protein [Varibaculum prostatecancerukia]